MFVAAGIAYLVDNVGMIVMDNYDFGIASFVGWGILMFLLLYKDRREIRRDNSA